MRLPIIPFIIAATLLGAAVYLFNSTSSGRQTLDVPRMTRLADIDGTETEVAIAPGGNRYAVIAGGELWILDMASGSRQRVTQTAEPESFPAWTPDGEYILGAQNLYHLSGGEGVRVGGRGAKASETEVRVREVLEDALLVEARPRSGRRHQVRAHLAHAGVPILGDSVYGLPTSDGRAGFRAAAAPGVPRLMLHAWRLALTHPTTGKPLVIESPIPVDFGDLLAALRRGRSAGPGREP